jgi:hypothetical protein
VKAERGCFCDRCCRRTKEPVVFTSKGDPFRYALCPACWEWAVEERARREAAGRRMPALVVEDERRLA